MNNINTAVRYLEVNFIPAVHLYSNIIRFVSTQGADEEDTKHMLEYLLDEEGLTQDELNNLTKMIVSSSDNMDRALIDCR